MSSVLGTPLRLLLFSALIMLSWVRADFGRAENAAPLPDHVIQQFGHPPAIPAGPLPAHLQAAVRTVFVDSLARSDWTGPQAAALDTIARSKDPRLAWTIADMMRFTWRKAFFEAQARAALRLLEFEPQSLHLQREIMDRLIAWDIPAYPGYLPTKRAIFTQFVEGWDRLFVEGAIDWRLVTWGGVAIDDRPHGTTDTPCNCIPAADNPDVSRAEDAAWLKDHDVVFGIEVNGTYRAYPRRIMEVREMVNDTLGGRDLAIPYCTLCGAAQAYFTDQLPAGVARPVLRTSGLLLRSNKVMYDVNTSSVFDTFAGKAVTGPLATLNLRLERAGVVTTDWGSWKQAHPETTVLVEALALGRDFDFRNGRDGNGPIFPIGDVDPRLPVHEEVIGVVTASGKPVAFQRSTAFAALTSGVEITHETVRLKLDAGGIRAVDAEGSDLGSHQAFWFAWSQFHPETVLWTP